MCACAFFVHFVGMGEADFARDKDLFGPFKNTREATRTLRNVADAHGLCHGVLGLEQLGPGRPCFSHQIRVCKGACVGKESLSNHSGRLMAALARLRIQPRPFAGAALMREGDEAHVVDGWRYLGIARSDEDVRSLVGSPRPAFDRDIHQILIKVANRLVPV